MIASRDAIPVNRGTKWGVAIITKDMIGIQVLHILFEFGK